MTRRAAKIDSNHGEIVSALRAAGCSVQSLAAIGKGCPDLLIGIAGFNVLAEVKDGSHPPSKRRLTADQKAWHAGWRGEVLSLDDARTAALLANAMRFRQILLAQTKP